ncbi:iron complex transport system permease protein [Arthrobacter stackebrandtii]|uniref:Iron complex transport system permease protein n=1 Tax=Arthrobacter stackebrandtii TaxID=272161 RepID=A0ABS4YW00_9MICC|nr:iron ABC transporter permease [Arthrobacter stackebrandtii]MBP2412587.1 iron complex transport system permease protein [Arthrobacter stackebrandtii]PYH02326.1 heme ABC transporter permease [Arthrobacter stackebrandtii]
MTAAPATKDPTPAAGSPESAAPVLGGTGRRSTRNRKHRLIVGILAAALAVAAVVAAGSGQLHITSAEVVGSVLHGINNWIQSWLDYFGGGLTAPLGWAPLPEHPRGYETLWSVRFPRVVLAMIVGAALACAGTVMQGVFGNPLAEPAVVGVSSGAAVGASTAIVTGLATHGNWIVAAFAFFGGLITTLLVYSLSRSKGRTEVVTLVLTGIAVNAFTFALIAFYTYVADPNAREQLVFWQLGSLNGTGWLSVGSVLPLLVVGLSMAFLAAGKLDLLALGERSARHLGVNVERLRMTMIIAVALLVGAGVAFTGIVSFVGLVVPHLIRIIAGPGHKLLLPASALGGALLVLLADLGARTIVPYSDLPLGMLTALIGGPFFFWLLRRTRNEQGGWA